MRAGPVTRLHKPIAWLLAAFAVVLFSVGSVVTSAAEDGSPAVIPLPMPQFILDKRAEKASEAIPALTPQLLAAYVARQQELKSFKGFEVPAATPEITPDMLMGYITRRQNQALDAIETVDIGSDAAALTSDVLASYAEDGFIPTVKRVKLADSERNCLAQAIYHEARGEPKEGQLAVANVVINRAMSKKYPTTICGVVFQNADKGKFKCQFTFACDGRSDNGTERAAWNRALDLADEAFREFQNGRRPGVVPNSVLYYHTTAVSPSWSDKFRRVASIGDHIFYSAN